MSTLEFGWTTMQRLGKSVEELARETIEDIMGYQGEGGHKPARPDIQKLKDAHDLFTNSQFYLGDLRGDIDNEDKIADARKEWNEKYELTDKEISAVKLYRYLVANPTGEYYNDPQKAFDFVAQIWSAKDAFERETGHELIDGLNTVADSFTPQGQLPEATQEGKRFVGNALKKYEMQNWPMLYTAIKNALDDVYRRNTDSYKLWPRMVGWIKDYYKDWLSKNQTFNRPSQSWNQISGAITHIEDITTEGGRILDQLRRENRLPQNFDVNKIGFNDFEQWLMEWKRENLGSEYAGEVVYQFHDGWTIQKLTTPEQLQFEGDEMGHCVGGYAHEVGSGQTIIYSLRDPKGMPHVTMEIHAIEGTRDDPSDTRAAQYVKEYVHPDQHEPGQHYDPYGIGNDGKSIPLDLPFEVVQVQGNSNKTPKPEYQRKIKEFLDALRAKGWKFVRSEDWFAPFDEHDRNVRHDVADSLTARELDDWFDNDYKTHHEQYRGLSDTDPYGLPAERKTIGIEDWSELFQDILGSLINEYDRSRWQGHWPSLAQAVYHAWMIDIYKDHLDEEQLERHKKNLFETIQKAEEKLNDWDSQQVDYNLSYNSEDILDKFKDVAQREGVLDQIEQRVEQIEEEEYGDSTYLPAGVDEQTWVQVAQSEHEDLWQEAMDSLYEDVQESYSGDAWKFLNYLYMLAEHKGAVNPADLPDPNQRNGGLPSYEEIFDENMRRSQQPNQTVDVPGTSDEGLPGALSSWRTASEFEEEEPFEEWGEPEGAARFEPGEQVVFRSGGSGTVIDVEPFEGGWWYRVQTDKGIVQAPEEACVRPEGYDQPGSMTLEDWGIPPQSEDYYRTASADIQIHPIDHEHNVWFDEDGNQRARYRPGWAKNPTTGKMEQTGELEDTFLDKHGRQGQGWVAYDGENPIGSLTYVDEAGWHMLGTAYVHPNYREQGLFNRMVAPLRETGRPIDAYVWNNPWLKSKVRSWR